MPSATVERPVSRVFLVEMHRDVLMLTTETGHGDSIGTGDRDDKAVGGDDREEAEGGNGNGGRVGEHFEVVVRF